MYLSDFHILAFLDIETVQFFFSFIVRKDVTILSYSIPYVVIIWQPRKQGSIQYCVRRLDVRSRGRNILKAWDRWLQFYNCSEMGGGGGGGWGGWGGGGGGGGGGGVGGGGGGGGWGGGGWGVGVGGGGGGFGQYCCRREACKIWAF